jgi:hypothetical protein
LFGSTAASRPVAQLHEASQLAEDEFDVVQPALAQLRATVLRRGAELPTVVVSQVLQIVDVLRSLLGYVSQYAATAEQYILLKAVATDYLPTPLGAYLKLPASSRTDESDATAVLIEQLEGLYSMVKSLDNQVRTGAKTELAIHGRFLRDKLNIEGIELEGH